MTAIVAEPREECKRKRKLGMLWKTVTTHRFKELRHLRAVEKLAAWRRNNGFDKCDERDKQWAHSPLPPTPEQTTVRMWAEVNALKEAILMSGKDRSKPGVEISINGLEQGTASLTDEEFIRLERMIRERRGRAAAHVVVAPIDTAQHCSPRSSPEISFGGHVYMKGNNEGRINLERDQLESPSAGTRFVTPGQQCLPNWDETNHCRRLLARRHEFKFGGKHFFPHRTRYRDANR